MSDRTHSTPLGALDSFFAVIRARADRDPDFARDLVRALGIPVEFRVEEAEAATLMPYADPVIIAGKGIDEFRRVFQKFKDADIKKIIRNHNLASADDLVGRKGAALRELLWEAASEKRRQLTR